MWVATNINPLINIATGFDNQLVYEYLWWHLHWLWVVFSFENNCLLKTAYGDLKCLSYPQAYYGPRVNMPPYYNSAVATGHAPHPYMWGPLQVLPQRFIYVVLSSPFFRCCDIHPRWQGWIICNLLFLPAYDATLRATLCSNLFSWRGLYSPCSCYCKSKFLLFVYILISWTSTWLILSVLYYQYGLWKVRNILRCDSFVSSGTSR